MRARSFAAVVAIALPVIGIGVACTFPSPAIVGDDGGSSGSSGGQSGDAGDVDPNGKDQDAAKIPDGGAHVEAGADGGCGGNGCDCDNDTVPNQGCKKEGGPVDCDDFDPYIHPDAGFVSSPWDTESTHSPAGDWDCDNKVTKQYAHGVNCSALSVGCSGEGFSGDPGCGESGDYVTCGGLPCGVISKETRTQGCR